MMMNTFDFQREVIDASFQKPIVVDFWAQWCAPCRMLSPVLEKLEREANDRWRLTKINTEEHPQIAMAYKVSGIPAVKMFSEGKVVAEFTGALPERAIIRWLEAHLPTDSKKAVTEATQLIQKGDIKKAKKVLQYAIDQDNANLDARTMLAQLIFEDEPKKAVALVETIDESHPMFDKVEAMKTLYRYLDSNHEFEALAEKHNTEVWTSYLKGIKAYQKRDYDTALDSWIEAVIIDRTIDDDGPRKACVALFKLLGNDHELTQKYHRRFTSALF